MESWQPSGGVHTLGSAVLRHLSPSYPLSRLYSSSKPTVGQYTSDVGSGGDGGVAGGKGGTGGGGGAWGGSGGDSGGEAGGGDGDEAPLNIANSGMMPHPVTLASQLIKLSRLGSTLRIGAPSSTPIHNAIGCHMLSQEVVGMVCRC